MVTVLFRSISMTRTFRPRAARLLARSRTVDDLPTPPLMLEIVMTNYFAPEKKPVFRICLPNKDEITKHCSLSPLGHEPDALFTAGRRATS